MLDGLDQDRYVPLPEDVVIKGEQRQAVECLKMVVRDDRGYWTCLAKHVDICVTTESLPLDLFSSND